MICFQFLIYLVRKYTMIMKIGPHKASGIDKISARLLRIAKLLNLSFSTCKYSCFEKGCPTKPYATMPKGIMGNGVYGI